MKRFLEVLAASALLALSIGVSTWLGGEPGETERAYIAGWK
jgi:hypothetical protein